MAKSAPARLCGVWLSGPSGRYCSEMAWATCSFSPFLRAYTPPMMPWRSANSPTISDTRSALESRPAWARSSMISGLACSASFTHRLSMPPGLVAHGAKRRQEGDRIELGEPFVETRSQVGLPEEAGILQTGLEHALPALAHQGDIRGFKPGRGQEMRQKFALGSLPLRSSSGGSPCW